MRLVHWWLVAFTVVYTTTEWRVCTLPCGGMLVGNAAALCCHQAAPVFAAFNAGGQCVAHTSS